MDHHADVVVTGPAGRGRQRPHHQRVVAIGPDGMTTGFDSVGTPTWEPPRIEPIGRSR